MLEKILNYKGEIHWHRIEESDIKNLKKVSNFCELYTEISYDTKYARKPGFVNHLILPYPYTLISEKVFHIPEELDKRGILQIIFNFDEQEILHGHVCPFISTDKEKDEAKILITCHLMDRVEE